MAVKVKSLLLRKGSKGRPGTARVAPKARVGIHNTGNRSKGADAMANAKYLKSISEKEYKSWNETVDEDMAVKSVPYGERTFSFGDGGNGKGNMGVYAIEICMNEDGNLLEATDNAAYRSAKFLKYYKVKKAKNEEHIFQHNDFSGKDCPQMLRAGKPYSWAKFIEKTNWYLDALWGKKADAPPKTDTGKVNKKLVSAQKWAAKRPTLRRGNKNKSATKTMQKYLKKLGFKGKNGKTLVIDGYWEEETAAAFAKFQDKYDLVKDNVCGIKSWTQFRYRAS